MIAYYIDFIPFIIAAYIVLYSARVAKGNPKLVSVILINTLIFMLAQSAWFSSMLVGSTVGIYWSNYVWFVFNTLTMGLFAYMLHNTRGK